MISYDIEVQKVAIETLRTISREKTVQEILKSIVENAENVEIISTVVESLVFPFEQSIYFTKRPADAGLSEQEKLLMRSIAKAADEFNSLELKLLSIYHSRFTQTKSIH